MKGFVNNLSENEYIKTPIGERLKLSILIILKQLESSYTALLIYSATWHLARKISFARGLLPHDGYVICDAMSSNSLYHWKVTTILKFE